jgi:hypothetical protein
LYSDLLISGDIPRVYWTSLETEKRHGDRSESAGMVVSGDTRNKAQKKGHTPESMPRDYQISLTIAKK